MARSTRLQVGRFIAELRRRKVVRVAIAYAVVAWVTVEVSATILPYIGLPDVVVTSIIVLVAAGFPLALILSWAYDLQPDAHGWLPARAEPERVTTYGPPTPGGPPPAPPASRYTLPLPPHPLVGRRDETAAVATLLQTDRLVTIVGPGGVGKTRLALEVGQQLQAGYEHGACFVPLVGIHSAEPMISELALRLRLPLGSTKDPRGRIIDYLREKEILLVLDNFEHLTGDTALLLQLLEAAPGVRIVVTSRERLRLSAESLFPLDPLPLSAPSGGPSPAEELFLQVARRLEPSYAPGRSAMASVRRICERLEGVPLAIELAAAWLGSLSEPEIESELERSQDFLQAGFSDVPDRHRSLRAAFESSWLLLEKTEQQAFARLAVFSGGFGRAAAEAVAGATRPLLAALQGKSLIRGGPGGRYEVLELLRRYAEEKLEGDREAARAARMEHCEYFARALTTAVIHPETEGAEADLEAEIGNIREAWLTAVRDRRHDIVASMLARLFEFYQLRGWAREGEEMFAQALGSLEREEHEASTPSELHAALSIRLGLFRFQLGLPDQARAALELGARAAEAVGNDLERAVALDGLAQLAQSSGDYEQANACLRAALEAAERTGDWLVRGRVLAGLGLTAWMVGDNPSARRLFEEAIQLLRRADAFGRLTGALRNLGVVEAADGNPDAAERLFREALEIDRRRGNQRGISFALQHLAVLAHERGHAAEAEKYLDEAIPIAREAGNRRLLAYCSNERALLALRTGSYERARGFLSTAIRVAAEIGDRPLGLQVLIGYARVIAEEEGGLERAVELLSTIAHHPAADQGGKREAAATLESLRQRMDEDRFAAAARRGGSPEAAGAVEELLLKGDAPNGAAIQPSGVHP